MRKPVYSDNWPESWKVSHIYDLQEVFGAPLNLGYAYAYENRWQACLRLARKYFPVGGRILDIAAAQGNASLRLAEAGFDVTWNDLREELIGYVRLKHEHGRIEYLPGNVFALSFPKSFDGILVTEIIEHVAHPDQFLSQVKTLIRPGGHIVLTTPNGAYFRSHMPRFSECTDFSLLEARQFGPNSDGHIFHLWKDEMEAMSRQAGLEVVSIQFVSNPLTNGHIKLETLLHLLPKRWVFLLERLSRRLPESARALVMNHLVVCLKKPGP